MFHLNPYEDELVPVEEARARILSHVKVLPDEVVPLLAARGQVLAEDIRAGFDVPPSHNSAMDGYAVRSDDVALAAPRKPVHLPVVGAVAAGETPKCAVAPGTAVRIMTGAPLPEGADAVVPFEDTDELPRSRAKPVGPAGPATPAGPRPGPDAASPSARPSASAGVIGIMAATRKGANTRRAGEDIREGSVVLARGAVVGPAEMGLIASLGLPQVRVTRRPIVAIVSTGDELLAPGDKLLPGKVYDANAYALAGLAQAFGGIPRLVGTAADDVAALNAVLDRAVESDLVVTSAGVSRGDYDMVKDVLASRGRVELSLVRMRPAKPLAFGTLRAGDGRDVLHLGVPGNPAAAMVAFELFGRPVVEVMMGKTASAGRTVQAVLDDSIINPDRRRVYARVVVYASRDQAHESRNQQGYRARLAGNQGSGVLTTMAAANGLAICPEDVPALNTGDVVTVQLLEWGK